MADEATTPDPAADEQQTPPAAPDPAQDQQQGTEPPKPSETDWKAEARKWEQRAKANADAAKELDQRKQAEMSEQQKAEAAAQEASQRAEQAERRAALAEAAITHGLTKDDLELLDGVPADQIDDRAKKLADRIKAATPAGKSGTEAGGSKGDGKPTTLTGALSAHLSK